MKSLKNSKGHVVAMNASPSEADFVISSIDYNGTPGRLNQSILNDLGISGELPQPNELQKGYCVKNYEKAKIIYVVTVGSDDTEILLKRNLYKGLQELFQYIALKKVWIPLIGTGSGGLSVSESYNLIVDVLNSLEHYTLDRTFFTISLPDSEEGKLLFDKLNLDGTEPVKQFLNNFSGQFFLVGSYWSGHEQSPRFFEESIWENGDDETFREVVNMVRAGDLFLLKSTYANQDKISYLRIKGIGIVKENYEIGAKLKVDWKIKNIEVNIPHYGSYRDRIEKVQGDDLITILTTLTAEGYNISSLLIPSDVRTELITNNPSRIASLESDNDTGIDYLGITKDVTAFAKIIASRNFKPPLAIALFGNWGSGKSFFMKKLRSRIDKLSNSDTEFYCKGVVQIHFNAWSYLDANLWASFVTQIFQKLNEYIKNDTAVASIKNKIENELVEKLTVSKEQQEFLKKQKTENTDKLLKLNKAKSALDSELKEKIRQIKTLSFKKILNKVNSEYKISEKLKEAFASNSSLQESFGVIKENVPEKYLNNPNTLLEAANSRITFLKVFFKKENICANIMWFSVSLLIISLVPYGLGLMFDWARSTNFIIPQAFLSLSALAIPAIKRYHKTYKKLQPIISALWNIKEDYAKQIQTAVYENEQLEKSLNLEIEHKEKQIDIIEKNIQETNKHINALEFKIKNTLSTEALYSFIENRSKSEDYRKHLGIISYIRSDFEILSQLLLEHSDESAMQQLDRPIERIILYIDDLDRCGEDRVIEVLEAVNLLMAYPLFVVVVGVDPRWIRTALLKKYQLQFTGKIREFDLSDKVESIEVSNYLEKIFQIPFHLGVGNDQEIKQMLKALSQPKNNQSAGKIIYKGPEIPLSKMLDEEAVEDLKEYLNRPSRSDMQNQEENDISGKQALQDTNEYVTLSDREIELMQDISLVIGKNPRAIKRFVNIYQIVKAHEGMPGLNANNDNDKCYLLLMFLLAVPIGPYKKMTNILYDGIYQRNNHATINALFAEILSDLNKKANLTTAINKTGYEFNELNEIITSCENGQLLLESPTYECIQYLDFIKRFTFSDMI